MKAFTKFEKFNIIRKKDLSVTDKIILNRKQLEIGNIILFNELTSESEKDNRNLFNKISSRQQRNISELYRFLTLFLKKILTFEKKNVYLSDLSYLSSEDEY